MHETLVILVITQRYIELENSLRKKLNERMCVMMRFVLDTLRQEEEKERLPVLRMEIDYELLTLYDAMQTNDMTVIVRAKERLKKLTKELIDIERRYANSSDREADKNRVK